MERKRKLLIKSVAVILLVLNLTGCWSAHELNKLAIVMGVGIDKSKNEEKVHVTVQVAKVAQFNRTSNSSGNSSNSAYANLEQEGGTIVEALENFTRLLDRRLLYSHNQVIIFSKEAAEQGISDYIDFFLRNRDTRLLVWLLVSDQKPNEILSVPPILEAISGVKIGELIRSQQKISIIPSVDLREFVTNLMSKTTAPVVPIIRIQSKENQTTLFIEETAVFKKDKMIGALNKQETRGLLWATDKVKDGDVFISLENGKEASIQVTRSKSKIIPKIDSKGVNITVEIETEGDLQEQSSFEDLVNPKGFNRIEEIEEATIKEEVMRSVERAKQLNADIFGFGDALYKHYPQKWKSIEKNWDDIFQDINIQIKINAKLRRNGRITKPVVPKER
ncbi:Ger(x)C family spore germination protein [Clostridium oryzae]|uniref:Spore germination protein A3 n=1 Tax=Clostridium oryzae TaxID=1450648 RepID=A0A1V4IDL8_9CLOT|nr:Ger(x)C family spore germination protein [Clostridium oryzae]OPJ58098.1 spore germination protein A3 precursor [Clostridium oryzae]